jgi:hypothetical protein
MISNRNKAKQAIEKMTIVGAYRVDELPANLRR